MGLTDDAGYDQISRVTAVNTSASMFVSITRHSLAPVDLRGKNVDCKQGYY